MRYAILIPVTVALLTGCFSDKKVSKKNKDENLTTRNTIDKTPKKEVYPIELNSKQKKLYKVVEEYLNRLKSLDVDGIIYMTYPKFFTAFNKSLYRSQILTITNSSNLSIVDFSSKIRQISEIYNFSNGEFAQVEYTSTVKVYLQNSRLYNTKSSINTLYSILVRKYGREHIDVDTQARVVTLTRDEKLLAIKDKLYNNEWKFIGDNNTYREIYYQKFMPIDILNQI